MPPRLRADLRFVLRSLQGGWRRALLRGDARSGGARLQPPHWHHNERNSPHNPPKPDHTFRKIFLRYITVRIPNQKRTKVRANASDATRGGSHERYMAW